MTDTPPVYSRNAGPAVDRGRTVRDVAARKTAAAAVGPLLPGCEIFGLTKGQFSLVDVILHCLEFTGPAALMLTTWTAAGADIRYLGQLVRSGQVTDLKLVTDASFPSCNPAGAAALQEAFGPECIRLTKCHAKLVLIRNDDWQLVIRTSMNLNENRRLEFFEISDSRQMADCLAAAIDQIFQEQDASESWDRSAAEHTAAFETMLGESCQAVAADFTDENRHRFFGDGVMDTDLRRAGLTFTRSNQQDPADD